MHSIGPKQYLEINCKGSMIKSKVGGFLCCFLKICDEPVADDHTVRFLWYPTFRIVSYFCLKPHVLIHHCEILHSPVQHKLIFFFNNTSDVITSYWIYKIKPPNCESRDVIWNVSLCDQDIFYIKGKLPIYQFPESFHTWKWNQFVLQICYANYKNQSLNRDILTKDFPKGLKIPYRGQFLKCPSI